MNRKHAAAGAIILALAFGFGGWKAWGGRVGQVRQEGQVGQEAAAAELPVPRHPLTGLPLLSNLSDLSNPSTPVLPRVSSVMIDNSVDAWPVSGVDKAFLVIEAPVEAAIPRLEAFFSSDATVEKIGPVRSARPYFVDWAGEFDALYAHVGGSNDALELIASSGTFDLNEYSHGSSFWRSRDRLAPHNVYTSSELLAEALVAAEERGRAPEVLYGTWTFKDPEFPGTLVPSGEDVPDATKVAGNLISVRFNSDLYVASWSYDPATGIYLRSQGGRAAVTQDGVRMSANNVVVLVTDVEVLDYVGRRSVRTTGEGKAWVLQDGATIEATWKKSSVSERLAFYDASGNVIAMNAGATWIEVAADETDVDIKLFSD